MKIIIDRIEENSIILELPDLSHLTVSDKLFPDAKEGDIFEIIKSSSKENKEKIKELENELFQ